MGPTPRPRRTALKVRRRTPFSRSWRWSEWLENEPRSRRSCWTKTSCAARQRSAPSLQAVTAPRAVTTRASRSPRRHGRQRPQFYAGFAENLSAGASSLPRTSSSRSARRSSSPSILPPDGAQIKPRARCAGFAFSTSTAPPPGMGVRFDNLADAAVSLVQDFLSRRDPLFFDDE